MLLTENFLDVYPKTTLVKNTIFRLFLIIILPKSIDAFPEEPHCIGINILEDMTKMCTKIRPDNHCFTSICLAGSNINQQQL